MKKLLTLLAIGGMTLALAACGKESEKEPDGSGNGTGDTEAETQPTPDDNVDPEEKTDSLSIENVYWYSASASYETIVLFKDGKEYLRSAEISELPEEGRVKLGLYATYELKNTTASGGEIELNYLYGDGDTGSFSYTLYGDSCIIDNDKENAAVNISTTKYKNLTFTLLEGD